LIEDGVFQGEYLDILALRGTGKGFHFKAIVVHITEVIFG